MQRNNASVSALKGSRRLAAAWGIALGLYVLLIPTRLIVGHAAVVITDLAWTFAALLATVSCVRAGLTSSGADRTAWLLFGGAAGAWTAGQLVWDTYELVLGITVPFPSPADIGYLAFGPLMIAGLIVLRSTQLERRLTWLRLANIGLILCGLAVVLIVLLTHPFLHQDFPVTSALVAFMENVSVAVAFIVALY